MGHWRQPMLLFILPKKPQEMNDFSSFLAVFFYGLMSQSLFSLTVLLLVEYPISTKGIFRHPTNPVGCLRGVPLLSIWSANARPSRLVA